MRNRKTFGWIMLALLVVPQAMAQDTSAVWVPHIGAPQYVAVQVADVEAAVAWYRTAFGLEVLDDTEADDGRWRIVNLTNADLFVEIIRDNRAQPAERALGFAKVGFRVPDVAAVADRVAAATGERPRVIDFARHGVRLVQLHDPEGNIIQLTSLLEE